MTGIYIIGIDLGTTGCRASLYDSDGLVIANHYRELELLHPQPGAAEQDAEDWWVAVSSCIKDITARHPDIALGVKAICCSAQGHSWVMTDKNFHPVRPAMTWLDTRAAQVARDMNQKHAPSWWGNICGKNPGPWHLLPQLIWLRETEPQIVDAATYYLFAQDFLITKLTNKAYTDDTTAAGSLLFDIVQHQWSSQIAEIFKVDLQHFAPVLPAGSVVGELAGDVAKSLGLPAGVHVVTGAQDQKCAALGAGLQPGCATLSLGTSSAITALSEFPVCDVESGIPCFPYLTRDTWVLEAPLSTTGAALRWLRDFLGKFGVPGLDYAEMTRLAEKAPCGSNGTVFLPFLAGAGAPHWSAVMTGSLHGITLQTTPGDVVRAILEGVAYEIKTNLDVMIARGIQVDVLRIFGGGARCNLWAQIIADVTSCRVERMEDVEMAGKGAAILAHHALIDSSSIFMTANQWQYRVDEFFPADNQVYRSLYEYYVQTRNTCLKGIT